MAKAEKEDQNSQREKMNLKNFSIAQHDGRSRNFMSKGYIQEINNKPTLWPNVPARERMSSPES
jgi:hypothetical protein